MNISMHGKKIMAVTFPPGPDGQAQRIVSESDYCALILSATYHGDHDEFWILHVINDEELARFNVKYVESIDWQPEP